MRTNLILVSTLVLAFGHRVIASPQPRGDHEKAWSLKRFKSLVTFGDSYTDENRLGYFINNNGSAPPVGWVQPESLSASSGGRIWARYVVQYAKVNLYNYAVSGAVCSNEISPRWFSAINAPFPAVLEYEIPAFIADSKYTTPAGSKFLDIPVEETVYAIWIGTNDLGNNAFLTDSQVRGKTLVDYVECVYSAIDKVYKNGGRHFVIMNLAPLQLLPQYSLPENGGLARTKFFPDKGPNITEISYRMLESVVTVNDVYKYKTPYEVEIAERYPKAHIASFDTYSLISDIYYKPSQYLNGSAPLNVTGFNYQCSDLAGTNCARLPSPDSFLWFDELHPSEQADRIIAREFVQVVKGKSKWAQYWG